MPKNNSSARKEYRKQRAKKGVERMTPEERLLCTIFGSDAYNRTMQAGKPGTNWEKEVRI